MLARNALVLMAATALTAAVAGAQQPKSTTPPKSTATQQAPAAKPTSKTSTAKSLPISADSAKKIVAANEAGATVTSAKLHHASGKAYYEVGYKMKGESKTMHATVDANTGAFAQKTAPASTKSSTKKPS
jgi:uncharacterized membrane protein YkoI